MQRRREKEESPAVVVVVVGVGLEVGGSALTLLTTTACLQGFGNTLAQLNLKNTCEGASVTGVGEPTVLRLLAVLTYAEQIQCEEFEPESGRANSSNQAFQRKKTALLLI